MKTIKEEFDECVKIAKEIVRPHLRVYDEYLTEQEWEVVIILFKYRLEQLKPHNPGKIIKL